MSAHHKTSAYLAFSKKARARIRKTLPAACIRCGHEVTDEMAWHVGHRVDVALGGTDTYENVGPEHKRCNERAGGKLGARMTNTKRKIRKELPRW